MNENMRSEVHERLMSLRKQHRELDQRIQELEASEMTDQFSISRLKREKLHLKDEIITLEGKILPDIIA